MLDKIVGFKYSSYVVTTILSGEARETVVEMIHTKLIEVGDKVRENKIPIEEYLITKVCFLFISNEYAFPLPHMPILGSSKSAAKKKIRCSKY